MASKLTAAFVRTVTQAGKYQDQHGLILRVHHAESKQFIWRGTVRGKVRDFGLGGFPYVTLAEARETAFQYRKLARAGGDPSALRAGRAIPTFAEAAETVIELHATGWKDGGKSAAQWRASLRDYALPKLGRRRVSDINTVDVMGVLLPIWNEKRETARRVRQRISTVMKWAVAEGHRQDNPAGDAIGAALPKNGHDRKHQTALPHADVADAIRKVNESGAYPTTKMAMEFLTLTACRSGEVRGARWEEVDIEARTWAIPAERMKSKREHAVPLSGRAIEVLTAARELADSTGLVFPSPTGRVLSDNTLSKLLRDLDIPCVPHGMRSCFRDWCGDTGQPREVAEHALAHIVRGVEGAYQRSSLFERRRALMERWAAYLKGERAKVVQLAS